MTIGQSKIIQNRIIGEWVCVLNISVAVLRHGIIICSNGFMDLWIYGHQASILWIYLSASIADSPKKFSTAFLAGRRRCHIYTSTCHRIYSKSFILLNVFINSLVALKLRFTFNLWICFSPSFIYSYTPTSLYDFLCVKIVHHEREILLRWTLHFNQIDNIMKSSSSTHPFNATSCSKWCTMLVQSE